MTEATDVLCIGQATYDISLTVDHHPAPDEKTVATAFAGSGGGPAANAAVTVARLGGNSTLIAKMGNDLFGRIHLEELNQENVRTYLIQQTARFTPLSVILVKPDGRRTVVNFRKEFTPLKISDLMINIEEIRPGIILFDGHEPEISEHILRKARKLNIKTVLDAGSVHEGTRLLFSEVNYPITSRKFALDFSGSDDPEEALRKLSKKNSSTVITLGKEGLIYLEEDRVESLPAFEVDEVDTTGAGDIFHGAFAFSLARGKDFRKALIYASAAAALSCTRHGARAGIPTADAVEKILNP